MCDVQRVLKGLLLLLTVVVTAGVVYVVGHTDPVRGAGTTPGYSQQAAGPASDTPSPSDATATPARAVFLGDDYTAGAGASAGSVPWTDRVATALDLDATVVAEPGAGYATQGKDGTSYLQLVDTVVKARPDLVIVSGGRNDVDQAGEAVRSAAQRVFTRLQRQLPDATIIAVAPWWGDSPHPDKLAKVATAVRSAVQAIPHGKYLDAADPLVGHPEWMADEANPNNRGYAAISTSLIAALRPAVRR
jgi:lysophospholipase L1-like esterase